MRGRPLLMAGCDTERVDSLLTPIIHHRNTATVGEERREDGCREPRMIKYCGRRILCHPDFRLYLATTAPKPRPSPATASMVTLVNYGASNDTVLEELLTRALARVRPELYTERRAALKNIHTDSGGLLHLWSHFRTHLHSAAGDREALFDEGDVEVVADLTSKTQQMSSRLEASRSLLSTLDALRAELTPVARRGAKLYALLRSLAAVRPEYQTPLPEFYAMFDEALGGEFPEEYGRDSDEEYEDDDDDADSAKDARTKATSSQMLDKNQRKDEPVPESAQTPDPPPETATEKEDGGRSELFELPELIPLSGDGEQYSSLPDQQVTEMMGRLNALVFTRIKYSLYPEDRLPVAALLTLAVQEENGAEVTEEETSLLLQGNPGLGLALSLADFDSDAEPPTWLSVDRWDDLLAVSVLPGPLDSLCVHVAENSAAWQDWYRSPQLQTRPLPVDLAGVPRLIVLRLLRPDQLPAALQEYVAETSASVLGPAGPPTLPETPGGVLVLLPPVDEHRASELSGAGSTEDCISVIAERQGNVKVDTVTVADGNEAVVMDAVDAAERDNQWCVVRHLHLASPALLRELTGVVHRMVSSRRDPGSADTKPQTTVWFTTVPGHALPTDMLLLLHKLSWDALPELVRASGAGQAGETQDVGQDKLPCGSLDGALPQAIIAALRAVPRETWQQVAPLPQPLRLAVLGAAVVGGVVATRQLLGARGLSQYGPPPAPRHGDDLAALVRRLGEERVSTALVCRLLSQVGVGACGCVPWDRKLLEALAVDVISRVADAVDDTVSVGGVAVPVPPANVEPADYAQWLEAKMPASTSTDGLSLPGAVMRGYNDALAARLLHTLDHLYQAQSLPLGASLRPDSSPGDRALRLRAVLDDVAEQLPPLLELAAGSPGEYDFPYHRPSVLSTATVDPRPLPECVGRVLLEECLWINSLLCHVRQNLHEIRGPGGRLLLSGREALPRHLVPVVDAVLAECVPASWVHPNCQPCPHSLADWLADLRRRHQQMRRWVRAGLVAGAGASDTQPRGRLTEVWAGGLANPRALFVALRQEKAVLEGCLLDQVRLEVGASEQEGESITLLDVHLQGASWDADRECVTKLSPSTGDLATLPGLSVRAVTPEGTPQNTDSPRGRYRCPVYVNTARQVCQLDLDLSCEGEEGEPWAAKAGVGLVLQAGIPESATKSRRSLLVAADNARQTSVRSHSSGSSGQEEEDEDFSEDDGEETERSQQSQLSYKTMTPQATPLPPELLMTRGERPMAAAASPQASSRQPSESSADSRPRAASRTSHASRGSHTSRTSRISQGSRSKASSKGGQSEPTSQGRASEGKSRKESTQNSSDKGSNSDRGSQGNPSNKGSNGRATPDSTKDTASLKSDQRTTDRRGSRTSVASGSKQSARSHSPRTSEQAANSPRTSEQPANSPRTSEQPANSPRTSEQAAGSIRSSGQATNSPRTKGKVSPAPSNKSSEKDRTREEDNPGRAGFLD